MKVTESKLDALTGDAKLLSTNACSNAWGSLREVGIDPENSDYADLVLKYWVEEIITTLSFDEHTADIIKTFADIGITA